MMKCNYSKETKDITSIQYISIRKTNLLIYYKGKPISVSIKVNHKIYIIEIKY